jgi:hypothetical protein
MEENKKIDIVYPLGDGSCWDDNELRLSLRSLEKYFKPHVGKVFILSNARPRWIQNIEHIHCVESSGSNAVKTVNVINKLKKICTNINCSEDFVLMNDDFFFMRHMDEIPNYCRGSLAELINRHPTKAGYYYRALCATKSRLEAMGIQNPIDFEIHAPMIFNRAKLLATIGLCARDDKNPILLRSCYGNLHQCKPKLAVDFKAHTIQGWYYQRARVGGDFLSICDGVIADEGFRQWMVRRFKNQSTYERIQFDLQIMPGRSVGRRRFYANKNFNYENRNFNEGEIIPENIGVQLQDNERMAHLFRIS